MGHSIEICDLRIALDIEPVNDRIEAGGGAWLLDRSPYGETYRVVQGVLSTTECERAVTVGRSLVRSRAQAGQSPITPDSVRKSNVAWMFPNELSGWLFEKLGPIAKTLNAETFGFDLYGFTQGIQFTMYEAPGAHYDWHLDYGPGNANRKLSIIVQLSDPDEYEGGEVEFMFSPEPLVAPKAQGTLIMFPSYLLHRVKPVTAGERFSLVAWLEGPALR